MKTFTNISAGIARIVKSGLFISLVFMVNIASGQTGCGCTMEHTSLSSPAQDYTLSNTDVLCIKSGTWTGNLDASSGGTLCVESGAEASPLSINGWVDITNQGKLIMPGFNTGPGQSIDNTGILMFAGSVNFTNPASIVNNEGGQLSFMQSTNFASTSSIVNNDTILCVSAFSSGANSSITNNGFFLFASEFNPNGTVENNGFIKAESSITINTSANFTNNCSAISKTNFTNSNTNTQNNGHIIITGSSGSFVNQLGTITTGAESSIKGADFNNSANISGSGEFYFSGNTVNFGTFSSLSTINFYDTGMPSGGFDTQSGTLNGNFSYSAINEPLVTDVSSGCSQFVKDAISGELTVELSIVSETVAEGSSTAIIATASQVPTSDIQVSLWAGGTASSVDYGLSSTVITIPAGSTTGNILLSATDDNIYEPGDPETVAIEIASLTNAAKGQISKVTASIIDNETIPTVTLSKNIGNIGEKGSVILTATLNHPTTEDVFVTLAMSGTATNAEDYTVSIVVPAGQTTGSTVLTAIDDDTYELGLSKVLVIDIDQVFNAVETGAQQETIVISDDDGIPSVDIVFDRTEVGEGGDAILFVKLSNPSIQDISIDLAFSGTAVETADYTVQTKDVLIPAGDTIALVEVYTIDDDVFETTTNETVVVDVSYVSNGTEEDVQKETLEIVDDESNIIVSLNADKSVIAENETVTFTASLSSSSIENVIVDFTFSGSAINGTDYTATTEQISIPAGSTEATFSISAIDDILYEPGANETIIVDIDIVTNGVEDGNQQEIVEIVDNDAKPSVTLVAEQSSIEEGNSTQLTANLSNPSAQEVTVRLGFSGTATKTDDYTVSSETITIPAGQLNASAGITAVDDNIYETEINDTIIVDVVSITNGLEDGIQQEKIEIVDNETKPTISIDINKTSITETGSVLVTAEMDKTSVETVTISFVFSGSATKDADYSLSAETIQIISGNTSGSLIINAIDDNEYEPAPDETVVIDVDQVTNGTENGTQQKTFVIVDNDELPKVSLSAEQSSLFEGSVTNITASLSNPASSDVVVSLEFTGTAAKTVDYTVDAELITILAGTTEASLPFKALEDQVYEGSTNEVATVSILNVTNATENGEQKTDIEILDKDRRPVVTMTSAASSVTEGGSLTIGLALNIASVENVQVKLNYTGTADYLDDFILDPITVNIPAGNTETSVTFTAVDDELYEPLPNETAIIDIAEVTNGSEDGIQQVQIEIIENDDQPTVSFAIDKAKINEGDSAYASISLSHLSTQTVTANLVMSGSVQESDYSIDANTISIAPGESSASIKLYALKDKLYEPDQNDSLVINISSVVNGFEDGVQKDAIKIIDTDSEPIVNLSIDKETVSENGTAELTASLSNASTQVVTVNLSYSGTATFNTDYTADASITIAAGAFSGTATITGIDDELYEAGNETVITDISGVTNGLENGSQQVTLELIDNESTVSVSISSALSEINEGQSTQITATLNKTSVQDVLVTFSSSGTAEEGTDFNLSASSVTIAAGNTSASVTLSALSDLYYEPLGNETATINIETVVNGVENGTQQALVEIADQDVMPSVSISADPAAINEGDASEITATLSHLTTQAVTLNLVYSGSAVKLSDYTVSSETITVPGGEKSASISLTAIDDNLFEAGDNDSVFVDINSAVNATEDGIQQAKIAIIENDSEPQVSLSANKTSINEDGSLLMSATLSHKSTADVTVSFTFSGTATKDSDYQLSEETLSISAGSSSASLTISGIDDDEYEPGADETVNVGINKVTNGSENGSQQVEFSIIDNDFIPTLSISLEQSSITEGSTTKLTAKLSNPVDKSVTVNYGFKGTAENVKDYTVSAETVTIQKGVLEASIDITALTDNLYEPGANEELIIEVVNVSNATEDGAQSATLTIIDADNMPAVSISADDASIDENGSTIIRLTMDRLSLENVTVEIATSGSAIQDTDYIINKTTLSIPAGTISATAELVAIDDDLYEGLPNENVYIDITSTSNADENGIQQARVEIIDNEAKPAIELSLNKTSIIEGDSAVVTANINRLSTTPVTAYFAFAGTVEAVDYQVSASRIEIPAGETSGSFTIYALDDKVYEPLAKDSLYISIASVVNAMEYTTQEKKLAIIDNNDQPAVSLSVDKQSVSESGTVTFTATLDGLSDENVTTDLAFTGTATKGTDYNPEAESFLILAGQQTASINVAIIDDDIFEDGDNETIIADIASVTNGKENGVQQKTVEIIDNESNLTVSLSVDKSQVTEGESLTLTVRLNSVSTSDVDVELSYSGTATKEVDYSAPTTSLTILAGSVTAVASVSVIDDAIYESATIETIVVDIASVNNAIENGIQKQTIEIIDNDAAPTATLTADKTSITETGTVTLTVELSNPAYENAAITLGLAGTATNGIDYTISSLTMNIPAGGTKASVSIAAIDDDIYETAVNETINVSIASITNATEEGEQVQHIEIVDNETIPELTLSLDKTAVTESESVVLTATLTGKTAQAVGIDLAFSGTATKDADYLPGAETMAIASGQLTASIVIQALDDSEFEPGDPETVEISIGNLSNAVENGVQQKSFTIADNDAKPTVSIALNQTSVQEGSTAQLIASLSNPASSDVTVNLAFAGTATQSIDYSVDAESIVIPKGSIKASLAIATTDDNLYESAVDETVIISISTVTNADESGVQESQLAIVENDNKPSVSMSLESAEVPEGENGVLNFTLSNPSVESITVELELSGTATKGADYTVASQTITFDPEITSQSIQVVVFDDEIFEPAPNETIAFDISSVLNGSEEAVQHEVIQIIDNDLVPSLTFAFTDDSLEEGNTAKLIATISHLSTKDAVVEFSFSGTATNDDYSLSSSLLTIPAGSLSEEISITAKADNTYEPGDAETLIASVNTVSNVLNESDQTSQLVIVDKDSKPTVSVAFADSQINEGETGSYSVTMDKFASVDIAVSLEFSGTADLSVDYTVSSDSLIILAGNKTATAQLSTIDDDVYETAEAEMVYAEITATVNADKHSNSKDSLSIADNDAKPIVSLSIDKTAIAENGLAVVTASLSNPTIETISAGFTFSGTATLESDYTVSADNLTIEPGKTSKTISIIAIDDDEYEAGDAETVIVDLASVNNGNIGSEQQVQTAIIDNESNITLAISFDHEVLTEGQSGILTAELNRPTDKDVSVSLAFAGTATEAVDYTYTSTIMGIAAGDSVATISIETIDDVIYEQGDNETIIVSVTEVTNAMEDGNQLVTIGIADNDSDLEVTLTAGTDSISESGSVILTATSTSTGTHDIYVVVSASGTATESKDFTLSNDTIVIKTGEISGSIELSGIDDNLFETSVDETAVIEVSKVEYAKEQGDQMVSITISDNDNRPEVWISAEKAQITEGETDIITTSIVHPSVEDIQVKISFAGSAQLASDYTFSSNSTTIPAGSLEATLTVVSIKDSIYEPGGNEIISVAIDDVTNAFEKGEQKAAIEIVDADSIPTINLSASNNLINEGESSALTATISGKASTAVTAELLVSGSAVKGIDYEMAKQTITIPAGSLSSEVTFTALDNSAYYDENRYVDIELDNITNAEEKTPQSAHIEIAENDTYAQLSMSLAKKQMLENGSTSLNFTLDHASNHDVQAIIATSGTATKGKDYSISADTVLIKAGNTSGAIAIDGIDDASFEGEAGETAIFTMIKVINAVEPLIKTDSLLIIDDDQLPSVSLSTNVNQIIEGDAFAITATLNRISSDPVEVKLSFEGTATKDDDYTVNNLSIIVPAGSESASISVSVIDDEIYEAGMTEKITASISVVKAGAEQGEQELTVEITDNDPMPKTKLSFSPKVTDEGATLYLKATTDRLSSVSIPVDVSFSGTATEGVDYTPSSWQINIPANSYLGEIPIKITDDILYETDIDETILATISSISGAEAKPDTAFTQIEDNERLPGIILSVSSDKVTEGQNITVTYKLSHPSVQTITGTVAFEGTAMIDDDFSISSGSFEFAPLEREKTASISILDDNLYELEEIFAIKVDVLNNADIQQGSASITIEDTDSRPVASVIFGDDLILESESSTIHVEIDKPSVSTVQLYISLYSDNEDKGYISSITDSTIVVIPAGSLQSDQYIIEAINDELYTNTAITVTARISSIAGAEPGPETSLIIISDDEEPVDTDGDGIYDFGNGKLSRADIDDDNDGILDEYETLDRDTDNDGTPDRIDLDSDNDGISDIFEAAATIYTSLNKMKESDMDGDGMIDNFIDNNKDGFSDQLVADPLPMADTDLDGKQNFIDTDSDGDSKPDALEGTRDCDEDGIMNWLDKYDQCGTEPVQIFTPNDDGVNDYFMIGDAEAYPNNKLQVFNRWGNLVYETEGYNNDWDGSFSDDTSFGSGDLPIGTYFYIFDPNNSKDPRQTGYVYITR